jgi:hypothetical protein
VKKFLPVILILLVLGGGAYYFLNSSGKLPSAVPSMGGQKSANEVIKSSLKSILETGQTVTCSVNYPDQEGGKGTIYISGKRMAGEFTTVVEGKEVASNMIQDGNSVYIWSSDRPTEGIKMTLTEEQKNSAQKDLQGINLNKEGNVNCKPWGADPAKFVPPSNINFTDLSAMMNGALKGATGAAGKEQSPCAAIPDAAAKAECEKSLNPQP